MGYTSFELMKKFNIKKGSWYSLSKKLNLDEYCSVEKNNSFIRKIYSEEAFNLLQKYCTSRKIKENFNSKSNLTFKDDNSMILMQQNSMLLKNYQDIKDMASKFEELYNVERNKAEEKTILATKLQEENNNLKLELEKIKNRNFLKRIFNIF